MAKKRWWAKSFPALAFMHFFVFSSIFTFAFSLETYQKAAETRDGSNRIGLGLLAGYGLFPSGQIKGGAAFGATFSFGFSKNIAIELAGMVLKTNVEKDPNTLSKGKLTTMPLQLSLLGRFPISSKLTPYVLAGGSYFLNSFTLDSAVVNGWNAVGFTLTEKIDNAFGFHFGGGLEFALGKALSAGVDVRYCLAQAKGNWSMKDNKSSSETNGTFSGFKLNTMILAVGLGYFFK
jgi:outer membrane protein W